MTVSKKDVWDDHSLTQHNFRQRVKYFLRNTRRDRDEYSDTKGARDRQTGGKCTTLLDTTRYNNSYVFGGLSSDIILQVWRHRQRGSRKVTYGGLTNTHTSVGVYILTQTGPNMGEHFQRTHREACERQTDTNGRRKN